MSRNASANRNTVSVFAALAALCVNSVVAKQVEHNGTTIDVHFRKLTAGEAEGLFFSLMTPSGELDHTKRLGHNFKQIATAMCNADGTACITPEEVGQLDPALTAKLIKLAEEVNGVGNEAETGSEIASDSGTTSPAT